TDIRGYGLLGGFDVAPGERPGVRGPEVQKKLFAAGLHIKFTGDAGIVAPPFIAEKKHIDEMVRILREVLSTF
ncbi:MAG TPA: beta 1,6 glucan synthase, partial [Candidatus Polarisedimenticolia bacterium]|nr:beta 1,6 glucan synthase [Candidatus Polarisedimenticolia bacterium]